ncbi:hypothetical protein KUTeg_017606 [Tegillarca granosa]|uniref:La-related protein 6 n=1 Tax=Tegillarca granosa TaxID=220873 RepID=A0ABQ9EFF0_TEGGR|nr:hypothetical protein KUTeg_017606 [Tegillarca granosa]
MTDSVVAENVPVIKLSDPPTGTEDENVNNVSQGNTSNESRLPRLEQLKVEDDGSSVYTSEEEGGKHDHSDDGRHTPEPEFIPPDDELKDKIIKQVEFYFSDANILKDAFLLKHVRRNKQGYVSIKLITSFKKVKSLTKDYRVVAYSLRQSDKLEVNEEGKKVRRKDPLPEYDETTPSRTVVAFNLPMENPTIENIAELFSKCGEVSLIRILRPGKSLPQDVKKHVTKHPEIGTTVCALVEFEKHEAAKNALETMTNSDDWRGLKVLVLASPKKKDDKKNHHGKSEHEGDADDESGNIDTKNKKRRERRKKNRIDELAHENDSCASSGSEAEHSSRQPHQKSLSPNHLDPNRLSPATSPRSSPRSSPMTSPRNQRRNKYHGKSPLAGESPGNSPRHSPRSSPEVSRKRYDNSSAGSTPSTSPWVQRRLIAAQEKSPLANGSPGSSPSLTRKPHNGSRQMLNMEGVMRQPHGPDGTKGFLLGRGKPRSSTFS